MEDVTIASVEAWYLEVEGRRIDLREGEVTIGRSRGCGVVLRDPSVSRGHALMSVQAGRVTLQDLRSSNGSYVNGARLDGETPLAEGDRVVIGETALYLRRARPGAAPAAAASDGAAFCPACGRPVDGAAAACPLCGADLGAARLPRRSEAVGLGEVLPVGEVLGAGSASWEQTTFRQKAGAPAAPAGAPPLGPQAAARESHSTSSSPASPAPQPSPPTRASVSPPPPADSASAAGALPPADAADAPTEEPPALAELPMSVRQVERTPSGPLPPLHPPPPPTGLLQRLAERLGLGRRA